MDTTTRVQRWRQRRRDAGKEAMTVWLSRDAKLRLEDLALQTFYVKPYSCGAARRRYTLYKLSAQTTLCRLSCSI